MYSKPADLVRSNSKSNIVNHKCAKNIDPLVMDDFQLSTLPDKLRSVFTKKLAKILTNYPTISTNAGVAFANEVCTLASEITIQTKKQFGFDASRQKVSKDQRNIGNELIEKNKKIHFENQSSLVIDHWSCHGRNFLAIISRVIVDNKPREMLLHFDLANRDKTSRGITEDLQPFLKANGLPVPIISDNCSTMVATEKYSENKFFKVFCLEHKLAIVENKLHKNAFFADIDKKILAINQFFNCRHEKFDLPRTPPRYKSATRPWRSNRENYEIFIANFDRYIEIKRQEPNFPPLPSKLDVLTIQEFENEFCDSFDILEKKTSNLVSGVIVYFKLLLLARNVEFAHLDLESIITQDLYQFVFTPIACCFVVLDKINLKGNSKIFCFFQKKLSSQILFGSHILFPATGFKSEMCRAWPQSG